MASAFPSPVLEYDRGVERRVAAARGRIIRYGAWALLGEVATWGLIFVFGQDARWALTGVALASWLVAWHLIWVPVGIAAYAALKNVRRLSPLWVAAGLAPWVIHSGWVAFILLMYLT